MGFFASWSPGLLTHFPGVWLLVLSSPNPLTWHGSVYQRCSVWTLPGASVSDCALSYIYYKIPNPLAAVMASFYFFLFFFIQLGAIRSLATAFITGSLLPEGILCISCFFNWVELLSCRTPFRKYFKHFSNLSWQ